VSTKASGVLVRNVSSATFMASTNSSFSFLKGFPGWKASEKKSPFPIVSISAIDLLLASLSF